MLTSLLFCILFINVFSKEYKAVEYLDVNKYIGKWYQVYQDKFDQLFQGVGTCSTAEYSIINDNKISIKSDNNDKVYTSNYCVHRSGIWDFVLLD